MHSFSYPDDLQVVFPWWKKRKREPAVLMTKLDQHLIFASLDVDSPEEIAMDVSGYIFTYLEWPHKEVFFDGDKY